MNARVKEVEGWLRLMGYKHFSDPRYAVYVWRHPSLGDKVSIIASCKDQSGWGVSSPQTDITLVANTGFEITNTLYGYHKQRNLFGMIDGFLKDRKTASLKDVEELLGEHKGPRTAALDKARNLLDAIINK